MEPCSRIRRQLKGRIVVAIGSFGGYIRVLGNRDLQVAAKYCADDRISSEENPELKHAAESCYCCDGSVTNPMRTNPAFAAMDITRATCS